MRILITGPECSGKTTLAHQLSSTFESEVILEYARSYLEKNGPFYSYDDLLKIAKKHVSIISQQNQKKVLFLDTFLFNIKIWAEHKYGKCHPWIINQIHATPIDLVLLLKPNISWVHDPLRESKNTRNHLFTLFEKELQSLAMPYYIIDGKGSDRLSQAKFICKKYI